MIESKPYKLINRKEVLRKPSVLSIKTRKAAALLLFLCTILSCKKTGTENSGSKGPIPSDPPGAPTTTAADFTIAVIPDTQYYMEQDLGGTVQMFKDQIDWIKANQAAENIVYVAGLGDIVDNGDFVAGAYPDSNKVEWERAKYYYKLETPFTGYTEGIPYGLAVGNHDQTGHEYPLSFSNPSIGFYTTHTTGFYNKYFGVSHFAGKSYYGGSFTAIEANNNDSHYDLFSAGGMGFIVIYLEYDKKVNQYGTQLEDWAYALLGKYSSRKAIIVTHALAVSNGTPGSNQGTPAKFYSRTQAIYDRLKSRKNVFLMLGGHVADHGEGYRQDTYAGNTIKSYVSGYQGRVNGGNGLMRLMKFSIANDLISVKTYSPYTNTFETDGDSQFSKPLFHEAASSRTCDFNNNGKSEPALFNSGVWKINGLSNVTFGGSGDIPVPADYDADGESDIAVFSPGSQTWLIQGMGTPIVYGTANTNIPVPGDYDGNGTADIAVYVPTSYEWLIRGTGTPVVHGTAGDIPIPFDFDGDGKTNIAVYTPSSSKWLIFGSSSFTYGASGDIPVPGDYIDDSGSAAGDGIVDVAVFRRSNNGWYVKGRATNPFIIAGVEAPQSGDIPAPGDYNGDGKTDMAVYRTSTKTLYVEDGSIITLGATGDKLLNLPYHVRKFYFP